MTPSSTLGTEGFTSQLDALQARLTALREGMPASPATDLVAEALGELSVTFEELRVAEEEIRQQADELLASQALLEAERQRYLDLFHAAPDGYLVTDRHGVIYEANRAAGELLDRAPERLAGKPLTLYVAPDGLYKFRSNMSEAASGSAVVVWDTRFKSVDRSERDVECTVAPRAGRQPAQPLELRWRLHDVTLRRQTEADLRDSRESLRTLSKRVEAVRESERYRIARAVHDEIGAALTAIKIDVAHLQHGVEELGAGREGGTRLVERAAGTLNLIDGTMQTVRRISMELRPAILDDFGLVAALDWQLNEFQQRTNVTANFNVKPGQNDVSDDIATAVFRVFQEILTNIARHAQATRVQVRLFEDACHLVLHVRDNGRGIQPEAVGARESLGLMGMHERVRPFGGRVEVTGRPGAGTQVRVKIPLQQNGGAPCGEAPAEPDELAAD